MTAAELAELLAHEVVRRGLEQDRVVLGIDGPDAAGKTTLADAVAALLPPPVVRASVDDFLRPYDERQALPYDESFDVPALVAAVLEPFVASVGPGVLVLDGVFLHRPELRGFLTLSVFLDVPPEETLRRARVRDLDRFGSLGEVERRYADRYLPAQARYRPTVRADLVVDNADPHSPVLR